MTPRTYHAEGAGREGWGMKKFVCSYRYQSAFWGFSLMAEDHDDAAKRLSAIRLTGVLDGEEVLCVPVPVSESFARKILRFFNIGKQV